ncbi:hypothetical protein DP44_5612 [Burkholderia pseudomallei]|nr:hypothetical protein DP44_5612 [Burkholderia pseudomallei]
MVAGSQSPPYSFHLIAPPLAASQEFRPPVHDGIMKRIELHRPI